MYKGEIKRVMCESEYMLLIISQVASFQGDVLKHKI